MKIGPYEVLGQLGRGGTGVVFHVRAPDGSDAALKLLQRVDPGALARFERERRLLSSFGEDQGFVGLLDAGTSPEGAWLVMPLVTGGTLRQKLDSGPLGVEETLALGLALAHALGVAHERGIVHRDLKPENVLFTASARPLVADLGLAKHFDRDAPGASASLGLSMSGIARGTAGYMSPEQATDARSVGPPSDVYALGAVLYECLAGRPALHGSSVVEVLARVVSGVVEPIGRAEVPAWLEAVVMRALAKDPSRRFADGARLEHALRRAEAAPRKAAPLLLGAGLGGVALLAAIAWGAVAWGGRPAVSGSKAAPVAPLAPRAPPVAGQPGARAAAERALELAREKFERKDFDGSIADCTRAIELDSSWAVPWAKRGHLRGRREDVEGAIADLTRAIELDPGAPLPWIDRSFTRVQKGDLAGAISDATRAIELAPEDPAGWRNRAGALLKNGDSDAAWEDLAKALDLDPQSAWALSSRGLIRGERGDSEGEIADQTRAIELDPTLADAWKRRGHARGEKEDWDGAIADCTRAIELEPTSAPAWSDRGAARYQKGDRDGGIADVRKASELDPSLPGAFYNLGSMFYAAGRGPEAIAAFERFLELAPDSPLVPDARRMLDEAKTHVR